MEGLFIRGKTLLMLRKVCIVILCYLYISMYMHVLVLRKSWTVEEFKQMLMVICHHYKALLFVNYVLDYSY